MKRKVITATVLILLLVAGIILHQNRHDIALSLNTDSEVMTVFEGISVGDTLDEVTAEMGAPLGTLEVEGEDTRYVKWPRYKGTTFAVKVVVGVVVEKYDRWGS
jgi:hypothetical protein